MAGGRESAILPCLEKREVVLAIRGYMVALLGDVNA
jgi:hypothetical protein